MKLQRAYDFTATKFSGTCQIIINRDKLYDKICLIKNLSKSTFNRGKKTMPVKILGLINLQFSIRKKLELTIFSI